jgi:folylpolyglutamate synthase
MLDWAIPEMHDYLKRIGYAPADLDRLNVVHITGTKGKGSTSAFTERILRAHVPGRIGRFEGWIKLIDRSVHVAAPVCRT